MQISIARNLIYYFRPEIVCVCANITICANSFPAVGSRGLRQANEVVKIRIELDNLPFFRCSIGYVCSMVEGWVKYGNVCICSRLFKFDQ